MKLEAQYFYFLGQTKVWHLKDSEQNYTYKILEEYRIKFPQFVK